MIKKGELIDEINEADISLKCYNEKEYTIHSHVTLDHTLSQDYPYFSGQIKYEFDVCGDKEKMILELEEAYGIVGVIVNGKSVETLIAPPYLYDISSVINQGTNHSDNQ